jgi:hypothetical protein
MDNTSQACSEPTPHSRLSNTTKPEDDPDRLSQVFPFPSKPNDFPFMSPLYGASALVLGVQQALTLRAFRGMASTQVTLPTSSSMLPLVELSDRPPITDVAVTSLPLTRKLGNDRNRRSTTMRSEIPCVSPQSTCGRGIDDSDDSSNDGDRDDSNDAGEPEPHNGGNNQKKQKLKWTDSMVMPHVVFIWGFVILLFCSILTFPIVALFVMSDLRIVGC